MRWFERPSRVRFMSVIAATVISLACGTNYVYSAWAPQFAQRLKLSATQSNLIGAFGNLGMYASGIPFGIMIDTKGPRWGVALGAVLFAAGYYPLARAYDAGPDSFGVAVLCIFSFFTGAGSCAAFSASIKTAALNYPDSRGTATAFPVAAFGLSAFAFATVALALPHDTSHFLLLLATGTFILPVISFPFLRVVHQPHDYKTIPQHEVNALQHTSLTTNRQKLGLPDTGAQSIHPSKQTEVPASTTHRSTASKEQEDSDDDDTASLFSTTSSSEAIADLEASKTVEADKNTDSSHLDIRGLALIRHIEFWQLFCMLGLLTGIGLMTINNIGNDAQALWKSYDPTTSDSFIAKRQAMHVSIISFCSFSGRLLSGIGSDVLANKYHRSRFWCLLVSALLFTTAQLLAVSVRRPDLLTLVSGTSGVAYGMLFGVYPSLIAHAFGVHGMSQNWGTMTLSPVVAGNAFNLLYGAIYDARSVVHEDTGARECLEGIRCYRTAYLITGVASLVGVLLCVWSIHHDGRERARSGEKEKGRERVA